jgi:hypothetical protein
MRDKASSSKEESDWNGRAPMSATAEMLDI